MILAGSTPRGIRTTPKLNRAHSTPTHKAPNAPRTLPNRIRTKINYLLRHNLFGSYSFLIIYIYTHCIYTIYWGGHPEIHPNPPQSTPPNSTEQTMCNCWSIVSSRVCYTFCCLCSRALPSQCQWIKSSKARMTELLSPNVWQKTQQQFTASTLSMALCVKLQQAFCALSGHTSWALGASKPQNRSCENDDPWGRCTP